MSQDVTGVSFKVHISPRNLKELLNSCYVLSFRVHWIAALGRRHKLQMPNFDIEWWRPFRRHQALKLILKRKLKCKSFHSNSSCLTLLSPESRLSMRGLEFCHEASLDEISVHVSKSWEFATGTTDWQMYCTFWIFLAKDASTVRIWLSECSQPARWQATSFLAGAMPSGGYAK